MYGQICLAKQREIIERLRRDGHPTKDAESLLAEMERTHAMRLESADRLTGELQYRDLIAATQLIDGQLV